MNSTEQEIPTLEQKKTLWQAAVIAALFVLILAAVGVGYGLRQVMSLLSSVLVPLGIAAILSILLQPAIDLAATRLTLRRNWAIILVLGIFFGLGVVLLFVAARSLLSFAANLPELVRQFSQLVQAQFQQNPELVERLGGAVDGMIVVLPTATTAVVSFLFSTVNSVIAIFAYVAGFIFVTLYGYFLFATQRSHYQPLARMHPAAPIKIPG